MFDHAAYYFRRNVDFRHLLQLFHQQEQVLEGEPASFCRHAGFSYAHEGKTRSAALLEGQNADLASPESLAVGREALSKLHRRLDGDRPSQPLPWTRTAAFTASPPEDMGFFHFDPDEILIVCIRSMQEDSRHTVLLTGGLSVC